MARLKAQIVRQEDTLESMQKNIASDPLLAFAILNEANRIVPNRHTEINTPFHAATMVGMKGIHNLFKHFDAYETRNRKLPERLKAFIRAIQTSYEAATIARHWSIEKLTSHEDDIFWITLFRDTARWLLWYHAFPQMSEIEQRIQNGENASKAETMVLGCRIDELTVHLCTFWESPNNIIESFLTKHIPNAEELQQLAHLAHHPDELPGFTEDKRLTILINNPLIFSYCATKVAHEVERNGWDAKQLAFFYRIISTVMHRRIGEVIRTAHFASTEAARLYNMRGKRPVALQLLDPNLYTAKSASQRPKIVESPLQELKKALARSENQNSKNRANLALKTIKQTIPSTQHSILFKHSKQKAQPLLQFGYKLDVLKNINWSANSKVFNKLSSGVSASHLHGEKLQAMVPGLPGSSDQIIDSESHLMLASAKLNDEEMMIFWLETRSAFKDKDFKTLKQIVSLVHNTKNQSSGRVQ
ncbi:hypothetical protein THO17_07860 [Marinomonas sp. THO17]